MVASKKPKHVLLARSSAPAFGYDVAEVVENLLNPFGLQLSQYRGDTFLHLDTFLGAKPGSTALMGGFRPVVCLK
jgi:hypothetical protein